VKQTGPTIHFKTKVTDEEMPTELANAEAFIFAAHEDFGIAPVEAMAAGTPVIAYKGGGAIDYIVPGKTGEFFDEQSSESLKDRLEKFNASDYSPAFIKNHSKHYSSDIFVDKLQQFIDKFRQ
jgi:glycosyltransferase involved in cell wall biosynthesis